MILEDYYILEVGEQGRSVELFKFVMPREKVSRESPMLKSKECEQKFRGMHFFIKRNLCLSPESELSPKGLKAEEMGMVLYNATGTVT